MAEASEALPDDVAALKAALMDARSKGQEVAAELAVARAQAAEDLALIAAQKLRKSQARAPALRPAVRALATADRAIVACLRRVGGQRD